MHELQPQLQLIHYDNLWQIAGSAFRYFDWGATFTWASSGAVLAARRGYDLTGIFAIGLVSSCGGGLLRDAMFLQAGPPALVRTPSYVLIALTASLLTWLAGRRSSGRSGAAAGLPPWVRNAVRVADALGLGAFAVVGMRLALAASIHVAGAMLVGVVNAVGGGIARSVLLREVPEVFQPGELTALAAFAGTLTYAALALGLGLDERSAGLVAIAQVSALRWISVRYHVHTRAAWSRSMREPLAEQPIQTPAPPRSSSAQSSSARPEP
ncbi:MAG TPA: TRIC cation channel family protein [Polyangiaceae bacterium]|nr:TRIC cation channel family protein [Polyangiaceae bacterium]